MRFVIERGQDVAVIGVVVFAFDCEDRDPIIANQTCGNVILRRKRIRRAQHNVGAAVAQANGQICRLGGHVQAGGNAHALQRLVLDEFLADDLQDLHGLIGPFDPLLAQIGKLDAFDITLHLRRSG